ncbi:MAG TPA: AIR synthase related protein [Bacillus sp. (in: firmicutes)]|uniref:AIR synthase related protein n=1 Tax=Bacillus litorisediminis TaxID=2922713 RepID=UPI001FACB53A|nr:AIR synthase related protein [Bacillus litorisediminis]HWO78495.1 AIR synthase related protein [Bacillus sp. (in: firmicutes)]
MVSYIDDPVKQLRKIRDLTLIAINDHQYIVIACDSDGGIGNKPQDVVKVDEETIAQFATRVPLFEIISSGASPFLIIDCLSFEMDGSGEKVIAAIKKYVREAGILEDIQVTGSTEDNVPTVQTGIGVTILGLADKNQFHVGSSVPGDHLVCVGIPKSGPKYEVRIDDPEIISLRELLKIRRLPYVHDILPVGSKGVLHEANQMAKSSSLVYKPIQNPGINMNQSAGPSTCVLLSIPLEKIRDLIMVIQTPIFIIGQLGKE